MCGSLVERLTFWKEKEKWVISEYVAVLVMHLSK